MQFRLIQTVKSAIIQIQFVLIQGQFNLIQKFPNDGNRYFVQFILIQKSSSPRNYSWGMIVFANSLWHLIG